MNHFVIKKNRMKKTLNKWRNNDKFNEHFDTILTNT